LEDGTDTERNTTLSGVPPVCDKNARKRYIPFRNKLDGSIYWSDCIGGYSKQEYTSSGAPSIFCQ